MDMSLEDATRRVAAWNLGQTSARYESSGLGAGVISTGRGDKGCVSYGAYQLSSAEGTLREYLHQSRYAMHFKGLTPATPAFDAKWRDLARTDPGFGKDQHDFIGRTHYDEQVKRLEAVGLDVTTRGRAVQDCVWSTSVQFRGLTPMIFRQALRAKHGPDHDPGELSDRQIIEAVQDYKIAHNNRLFKSSPDLWPGLLKRAHAEKADLVLLTDAESIVRKFGRRPDGADAVHAPSHDAVSGQVGHDARERGRTAGVAAAAARAAELDVAEPMALNARVANTRTPGASSEDEPAARNPMFADDPAHSDHATFERIHSWVRGTGHWDEDRARNVAAAVYRAQAEDPLVRRVDYVTGGRGRDGAENVFAVHAPWGDREPRFIVTVDGRHASEQPARENLQQAEQVRAEIALREHQQSRDQQEQVNVQQRAAQRSM